MWSYTGASNNESSPAWSDTSDYHPIVSGTESLLAGLNLLNTEIGSRAYSNDYYITSGESITNGLDDLDMSMNTLSQTVAGGVEDKYIVTVDQDYEADTAYTLPVGVSYTPSAASSQQGMNMDVYLDGQLLSASTGAGGVNEDKDYAETSPTTITFHFDIYQYSNLMFKVRT